MRIIYYQDQSPEKIFKFKSVPFFAIDQYTIITNLGKDAAISLAKDIKGIAIYFPFQIPDKSNWLIPYKILMTAYPDPKTDIIDQLIGIGITKIINLQTEQELDTFRSYKKILTDRSFQPIEIINFPIPDRKTSNDSNTILFIDKLVKIVNSLSQGQIIAIHCYGGHGRTGLISALLYGKLYGTDAKTALEYVQKMHDTRKIKGNKPSSYKSPQTRIQIDQVKRLLN